MEHGRRRIGRQDFGGGFCIFFGDGGWVVHCRRIGGTVEKGWESWEAVAVNRILSTLEGPRRSVAPLLVLERPSHLFPLQPQFAPVLLPLPAGKLLACTRLLWCRFSLALGMQSFGAQLQSGKLQHGGSAVPAACAVTASIPQFILLNHTTTHKQLTKTIPDS